MIHLFSKEDCGKCHYVKQFCPPSVLIHDIETVDGLAMLAWYELVTLPLPILLITDDNDREVERVTGAINIKRRLEG